MPRNNFDFQSGNGSLPFKVQKARHPITGEPILGVSHYEACCGSVSKEGASKWGVTFYGRQSFHDPFWTKAEAIDVLRQHHEDTLAEGVHDYEVDGKKQIHDIMRAHYEANGY